MEKIDRINVIAGLIVIALLVNVSLAAQFSGGSGSIEDPWQIETISDFDNIRNYPDSAFIQTDNIDLGAFTPIPYFGGVYNGNYYTISAIISTYGDAGLFIFSSGTLVRVQLVNSAVDGQDFTGGIVSCNAGTVIFCSVYGTGIYGLYYVGGIAGLNDGIIKESYISSSDIFGYEKIGGISADNFGTIENSYTNPSTFIQGQSFLGGLVGENFGSIENCYSTALVQGEEMLLRPNISSRVEERINASVRTRVINTVGGLIGYCSGTVTASYWDTETSGQNDSAGGDGKTTPEMTYPYDQDTYVDWDMACTWVSDDYYGNNGYPFLLTNWNADIQEPPSGHVLNFGGGNGSPNNPWLIDNPIQLSRIRSHLGDHFRLDDDIDFSQFITTHEGWRPIGCYDDKFRGSFDGDGYTIGSVAFPLSINRPNEDYLGLFGAIGGSQCANEIRNFNLYVDIIGREVIGSVVGFIRCGYMSNINVFGTINGVKDIGGIAGIAHSTRGILYCSSEVNINGVVGLQNIRIGGMIGKSLTVLRLENCRVRSSIHAPNHNKVGGIVGHQIGVSGQHKVKQSSFIGSITGDSCVGGVIGSNQGGLITESYASGNITGNLYVGGLVGESTNRYDDTHTGGGHSWDSYSTSITVGNNYTGGLVGIIIKHPVILPPQIINCYSTGQVISQGQQTGGLVGGIDDDAIIQNSFWDIESSGQDTSAGGTGLATVKMMQQDTYPDIGQYVFDFDYTWAISEWYNDDPFPSYPYLQWQGAEPDEHNEPANKDSLAKIINYDETEQWFWVSFPWLSRDADGYDPPRQTAEEALRPLSNIVYDVIIDSVLYLDVQDPEYPDLQKMVWDGWIPEDPWNPNHIVTFCSTRGYKIHIRDETDPDEYYLPLYGTRLDPETEITLHPGYLEGDPNGYHAFAPRDNWIGYFLTDIQCAEDGFEDILDDILHVKSQDGAMYRVGEEFEGEVTLEYGKMYKVALISTVQEDIVFQWNQPDRRSSSERQSPPRPRPQHFNISYGPDYESIFIADIADDEDVVEVGVYVGNVCIGASVFQEGYPLEILTYTNNSYLNKAMAVVLYLEDDSYERYDTVLMKDIETGQYSRQVLNAQENLFSIVKLDRTGGERSLAVEEEVEDIPSAFGLSQNYPNPFSLRTGHQGQTSISLSLPQDMPVSLNVYNIKGQLVRTLMSGEVNRGEHTARWNGKDNNSNMVSSGIYFYRLETPDKTITRKMLIVR